MSISIKMLTVQDPRGNSFEGSMPIMVMGQGPEDILTPVRRPMTRRERDVAITIIACRIFILAAVIAAMPLTVFAFLKNDLVLSASAGLLWGSACLGSAVAIRARFAEAPCYDCSINNTESDEDN